MDLSLNWQPRLSLFLLSAATLLFEINLTRLYSVSQFYHFAFLIVSLALLGYGASGTFLALFPEYGRGMVALRTAQLSLAAGLAILAGFILTGALPFDSYSIAWDRRQIWILALHYVVQAAPFFLNGLVVGLLLEASPQSAGTTYAVNLAGSAAGCALALLVPALLGGEGVLVLSSALAGLAALTSGTPAWKIASRRPTWGWLEPLGASALVLVCLLDLGLRLDDQQGLPFLKLQLSPYKGLSYALQAPGSQLISQCWNASSRVDVVRGSSIHSLPGLSFRYQDPVPPADGLLVDGDDLSVVLDPKADPSFSAYLPTAASFLLRPAANALVLEPRGGLDVFTALASGSTRVVAVEVNPLVVAAAGEIFEQPQVQVELATGRSYLRRSTEYFDVILLSLASGYHPVGSGAYSLAEDYRYTQEGFIDALKRLSPEGVFSVTRWLQDPPSESLRAFALAVESLEAIGLDPRPRLFAFRGYNTATILVKTAPFSAGELSALREFAASRAFDLIYAPDLDFSETNRYNVLDEPIYALSFSSLLEAQPRRNFYAVYPYDVSPPSDDHPFFGHYFKWSQAGGLLSQVGKTWQPFGGAGFLIILALLLFVLGAAVVLILLPLALRRRVFRGHHGRRLLLQPLVYFGSIGLAYLLVEIPLMQRFILYLGNPAYALTAVLFALLVFSALGSRFSASLQLRLALLVLVALLAAIPYLLPVLFAATLGLPLALRLVMTILLLAPLGFLMGVPFPGGLRNLQPGVSIPWVWAVNGSASVVASVLAALLALSLGFNWVLWIGGLFYLGAWLTAPVQRSEPALLGRL